ncbi:MAG TPA: ATP-binding protein [Polyangiaceae bacterium]
MRPDVGAPPESSSVATARLRALVASLGLGVLVEDEHRRVSLVNQALCTMFSIPYSPEDLVGADCAAAVLQSKTLMREPDAFHARIDELLAGFTAVTADEICFLDGRIMERDYCPITVDSAGRGHLWVYRDVTRERQEAEVQRAAAVTEELRLAIDTIPGLVFSAQPDGHVDFFNQRFCEYTGLSLEQACGSGWEAAVHADDLPALRAHWHAALKSGRPGETEARLRRYDGAHRWYLFRAVPLCNGLGEPTRWYGQTTDIDDRKRAEALLAGEKKLLEMVARSASLSDVLAQLCLLVEENTSSCRCTVLLIDGTGEHFAHGAGPSLPQSFNDAIHGRPLASEYGPCAMAVQHKEQLIVSDLGADTRWDAHGFAELAGTHGLRSCCSTPIFSQQDQVLGTFALYQFEPGVPTREQAALIERFTHLASVVIERKRSEEALQRAQADLSHVMRVTTMGELAASIAHEVNQPVFAMVANATACLNWLGTELPNVTRVRESLHAILSDGARAGDVLTRIRALLTRSPLAYRGCSLGKLIEETVDLATPELRRHGVTLEFTRLAHEIVVTGDPVELQQVLLNLVLNASEAARDCASDRRRVTIGARLEHRDDGFWALIAVTDAGVGIKERDLRHLFRPFYTTKAGGLGMGLSITRSIVERHAGRIEARPNEPYGSTFEVELPARDDDALPP